MTNKKHKINKGGAAGVEESKGSEPGDVLPAATPIPATVPPVLPAATPVPVPPVLPAPVLEPEPVAATPVPEPVEKEITCFEEFRSNEQISTIIDDLKKLHKELEKSDSNSNSNTNKNKNSKTKKVAQSLKNSINVLEKSLERMTDLNTKMPKNSKRRETKSISELASSFGKFAKNSMSFGAKGAVSLGRTVVAPLNPYAYARAAKSVGKSLKSIGRVGTNIKEDVLRPMGRGIRQGSQSIYEAKPFARMGRAIATTATNTASDIYSGRTNGLTLKEIDTKISKAQAQSNANAIALANVSKSPTKTESEIRLARRKAENSATALNDLTKSKQTLESRKRRNDSIAINNNTFKVSSRSRFNKSVTNYNKSRTQKAVDTVTQSMNDRLVADQAAATAAHTAATAAGRRANLAAETAAEAAADPQYARVAADTAFKAARELYDAVASYRLASTTRDDAIKVVMDTLNSSNYTNNVNKAATAARSAASARDANAARNAAFEAFKYASDAIDLTGFNYKRDEVAAAFDIGNDVTPDSTQKVIEIIGSLENFCSDAIRSASDAIANIDDTSDITRNASIESAKKAALAQFACQSAIIANTYAIAARAYAAALKTRGGTRKRTRKYKGGIQANNKGDNNNTNNVIQTKIKTLIAKIQNIVRNDNFNSNSGKEYSTECKPLIKGIYKKLNDTKNKLEELET